MKSSKHGTGSILVTIHVFHKACWFQVQATCVESDTFSYESQIDITALWVSLVVHDNSTRFTHGSLAYAMEQIHLQIDKLLSLDNSYFAHFVGRFLA